MRSTKSFIIWLVVITILALIVIMSISYTRALVFAPEAETRANIRTIQFALEKYFSDHQEYPPKLSILIDNHYLDKFPRNPFHKKNELPMKQVEISNYQLEGDFTYLPYEKNDKIVGFYILAYGSVKSYKSNLNKTRNNIEFGSRMDIDGDGIIDNVIIVVKSKNANELSMPPLAEFLHKLNHEEEEIQK